MTFRCFRAAVAVSWVLFFNAATAPSARPRYEVMPAEGSQGGVSAIHGITPQQLDAVLAETLSAELLTLPSRCGVLAFPRCCENLTASEFLRISRLFGGKEVVSRHVVHPSSPSEDILRLSNQAEHGVVQVGPQWHQDGSTEKAVFSHLLLHALRPGAPTHFADLAKAYEVLEPETQEQWSRMASVNAYSGAVHPLVHRHPITGQKVLFLHLGQTGALISWNSTASSPYPDMEGMVPGVSLPEPGYRTLSAPEAAAVMSRYDALLNRPEVHFQHRYEAGDLLLVDNLAVAHRADAAAQNAGGALRLLHRSTVRGVRNVHAEGLPSFLYIFGDNPDCEGSESGLEGLWQSADYYGVGFKWNNSQHFRN